MEKTPEASSYEFQDLDLENCSTAADELPEDLKTELVWSMIFDLGCSALPIELLYTVNRVTVVIP